MATPGDSVIIDNGSGTIKAGFAGEAEPRFIEKPIIGWKPDEDDPSAKPQGLAGSEIRYAGEGVTTNTVIERGLVTDWDGADMLWKYVIRSGLKVDPADHPVILTEPALNPKVNREKTAEIMMESVGCMGVYLAIPGMLSLFSTGRTSGVVLDSGYQQTTVVPVYQGYQLRPGTETLPLGGYDVTEYLMNMLITRGYGIDKSKACEDVQCAKEKVCYISGDFDQELSEVLDDDKPSSRCDYSLPDGSKFTVDKERFLAPELLFKPSLLGKTFNGIHVTTVDGVIRCDRNVHSVLFDNVLLSGGATCSKKLESRLYQEMLLVAPPMTKIKLIETKPRKRPLSAWTGGAMLGQLDTFEDAYVKQWEYNEYGPSIVHRKCF